MNTTQEEQQQQQQQGIVQKQYPPAYWPRNVKADLKVDDGLADKGAEIYVDWCMMCHGAGAGAAGNAPDLRASPLVLSLDAMIDVALNGSKKAKGMPYFDNLNADDIKAVQHYVRRQANNDLKAMASK